MVRTEAGLVYTAGQVPRRPDGSFIAGKLGADISVEEGYEAARLTTLGLLSTLKGEIGDLDRVARVVKLLSMVNCTLEFDQHPAVANGASDLLVELFGDRGRHARSAIGVGSLPGNALPGDRDDRRGILLSFMRRALRESSPVIQQARAPR